MKLKLAFLAIIFLSCLTSCNKKIIAPIAFEQISATHKIIAIIPADVILELRPNDKTATTTEKLALMKQLTARYIQEKMYSALLKKSKKNKYSVAIQNINSTDSLLANANLKYATFITKSSTELAQILGVDAVLLSEVKMTKPMSDIADFAVNMGVGQISNIIGAPILPTMISNIIKVNVTIKDATKGDTIWQNNFIRKSSNETSSDAMFKSICKKIAFSFPYKAKNN